MSLKLVNFNVFFEIVSRKYFVLKFRRKCEEKVYSFFKVYKYFFKLPFI